MNQSLVVEGFNVGTAASHVPSDMVAWSVFWICLGVYVVIALIFHHHWSYYGIQIPQKMAAVIVFNGTALALLTVLALIAVALSNMM